MSIAMQFTTLAFFLLQPVMSLVQEIRFSKIASTVENAANVINTKNRLPHSLPSGRWLKMFGSVINISFGPELTSTPYEKHAGNIISPEHSATKVSSTATFMDSPKRARSLSM